MASGDQEWESKCRSRGATTNLFAGVREPLHKANPQQLRSTWQLTHSYLERCEQAWRRRTPTIRQLEEQQIVSRPLLVDDGDRLVFVGQTLTRPISQHGFDELLESGIDDNRNVYTLQVHKLDNSFGQRFMRHRLSRGDSRGYFVVGASGSFIVIASQHERNLTSFEVGNRVVEKDPLVGHTQTINDVVVDGDRCVSVAGDGLRVWNVSTGDCIHTIAQPNVTKYVRLYRATIVTWGDNDDDSAVQLWSADSGDLIDLLTDATVIGSRMPKIVVSSTSGDTTPYLYDIESRATLCTFPHMDDRRLVRLTDDQAIVVRKPNVFGLDEDLWFGSEDNDRLVRLFHIGDTATQQQQNGQSSLDEMKRFAPFQVRPEMLDAIALPSGFGNLVVVLQEEEASLHDARTGHRVRSLFNMNEYWPDDYSSTPIIYSLTAHSDKLLFCVQREVEVDMQDLFEPVTTVVLVDFDVPRVESH